MFEYVCIDGSISWPKALRRRISFRFVGLDGRDLRWIDCNGTLWSSNSMLRDGVTAIDGIDVGVTWLVVVFIEDGVSTLEGGCFEANVDDGTDWKKMYFVF